TGQDLEHTPQSWWRWWNDYNELEYPDYKPTYSWNYRKEYEDRQYYPYTPSGNVAPPSTYAAPPPKRFGDRTPPRVILKASCFIAGTPVWTAAGLQPIETLRPGDRVLSQDPETGELAFKCVVETTLRPASPTFRIQAEGESLVAT